MLTHQTTEYVPVSLIQKVSVKRFTNHGLPTSVKAHPSEVDGVFPLSQPLSFPLDIEVWALCSATMVW